MSSLAATLPLKHLGTVLRPIDGQICGSQAGRLISCKTCGNGKRSASILMKLGSHRNFIFLALAKGEAVR